jgi:hypothetical protein
LFLLPVAWYSCSVSARIGRAAHPPLRRTHGQAQWHRVRGDRGKADNRGRRGAQAWRLESCHASDSPSWPGVAVTVCAGPAAFSCGRVQLRRGPTFCSLGHVCSVSARQFTGTSNSLSTKSRVRAGAAPEHARRRGCGRAETAQAAGVRSTNFAASLAAAVQRAPAGRKQHRIGGGPSAVAGERKRSVRHCAALCSLCERPFRPQNSALRQHNSALPSLTSEWIGLPTVFLCVDARRLLSLSLSFTFRSDLG